MGWVFNAFESVLAVDGDGDVDVDGDGDVDVDVDVDVDGDGDVVDWRCRCRWRWRWRCRWRCSSEREGGREEGGREEEEEGRLEVLKKNKNPTQRMWGKHAKTVWGALRTVGPQVLHCTRVKCHPQPEK